MIYAYYRVSTDRQDYNSQKVGVIAFANARGLHIDKEVIDDGISGTVLAKDRKLGRLLRQLKTGDTVITSELSRLGRSTSDVINTCQLLVRKCVNCYLVKQGMSIDNTPMGKMMIAILSAFAEMERDLISQRTVEGLKRAKDNGKVLGRPKGSKSKLHKLTNKIEIIKNMIHQGYTKEQICKKFDVSYPTLKKYIDNF